jgi:hypothetical protein
MQTVKVVFSNCSKASLMRIIGIIMSMYCGMYLRDVHADCKSLPSQGMQSMDYMYELYIKRRLVVSHVSLRTQVN